MRGRNALAVVSTDRFGKVSLVRRALQDVQIDSATDLFGTFLAQRSDLAAWTAGAEINTDSNLRLSYLAGWGVNSQIGDRLYRTMLAHRNEPANIFAGSPGAVAMLRASLKSRFTERSAGAGTAPPATSP
jgi:hypothetical protein